MGAALGALCADGGLVQCASLKSNMGHLEASAAAAGLASLALVPLGRSVMAGNAQLKQSVLSSLNHSDGWGIQVERAPVFGGVIVI